MEGPSKDDVMQVLYEASQDALGVVEHMLVITELPELHSREVQENLKRCRDRIRLAFSLDTKLFDPLEERLRITRVEMEERLRLGYEAQIKKLQHELANVRGTKDMFRVACTKHEQTIKDLQAQLKEYEKKSKKPDYGDPVIYKSTSPSEYDVNLKDNGNE